MNLLTLLNIDPVELTGFARDQVAADNHFLERVLPTRFVNDIDFEMQRTSVARGNAAKFRVWDTPAPIGTRPPVTSVRGALPPLSQKIPLGEREIEKLQALVNHGGLDPRVRSQAFDDVGNEARAVADRMELARGEALYTGKIVLAENGIVGITVDFGRAAGHTVTAGTLWSTVATATPITNLQAWETTYQAANGFKPGAWITSTTVLGYLLRNVQIQGLLLAVGGSPSLLTQGQVAAVIQAQGLAPIVVHDDVFTVDGVSTRPIPANRIVAVPPASKVSEMGASFWTTTAEAIALQAAGRVSQAEAPGITATIWETPDPVGIWTKASGVGLPFLANPDYTFAATVA